MRLHASMIASLPPAKRRQFIKSLDPRQIFDLYYDWRHWARPEQLAPDGNWRYWLYLAGRGAGKTRAGAEWVREQVEKHGRKLIHLIAPTAADYRDVMVKGPSGIIAVSRPDFMPIFEPSNRRVLWPNGSQALCFSAEEPERLRGPQCEAAWCDELCTWGHAEGGRVGGRNWRQKETWDMMKFGLRLGDNPQVFISTTPKPGGVLRALLKDPNCVITTGTTYDNRANLADDFYAAVIRDYEGTRLGRQELLAEVIDDLPGALWPLDLLDSIRLRRDKQNWRDNMPEMKRVVIGVDPSGSDSDKGSQQGIVVCGEGQNGLFYVLDDYSCSETPQGWARRVCIAFADYGANRIVVEKNFGGDMAQAVLRNVNRNLPLRMVTASHGKHIRAEPVAALYEQGRVRHFGYFKELEEQMSNFTHEGYQGAGSPDRVDAMVWAMTELAFPGRQIG